MDTLMNRICYIAERENITLDRLETLIGISKGVLSLALDNYAEIKAKWIEVILDFYPDYSAQWLVSRKGPVLQLLRK